MLRTRNLNITDWICNLNKIFDDYKLVKQLKDEMANVQVFINQKDVQQLTY